MRSISRRRVDLRVDGALFAVLQRHDLLRLAEVHPARQLAHDHDVEAFDQLALQRGGVGERRIADGRAQVGEQAEVLAQPQKPGLGAYRVGHAVPLGAADGAEDDRVGLLRLLHRGVGDGDAVLVVGGAADEVGLGRELGAARLVEEVDDALDLGDGFNADPVAGKEEQVIGGHAVKGPDGGGKGAVLLAAGACRGKGRAAQKKAPEKKRRKPFSVDRVPSPARMPLSTRRIVPPVMMATDASTMAICSSAWP